MAEIRVNVSSVGSKGTAQATNNAAQYWAEKAREWAISENPVSMEDNSSKYYAGKAKEYAQSAQQYKNDTQEIADTAESNIDDLTSDFNSLYTEKSEALQSEYSNYSSSLEAAKTSAITSIQTTGTEANTSITTASTTALSDIATAKNTAVEDIQDEADTQISNIQSTGFYMRDDKLYYVDSEGQEQEFKNNDFESIVPYTLFDSKYSEAKQYNASWVLGGSTLSKSVYPTVYEAALVEYNSEIADGTTVELPSGGSYTKRGVSGGITVKLSTDETVTEYDWKLDTVAEILTVPTLNGSEDLLSDRYDDLELKASGSTYTAPANGWFWIQKLSSSTGQYLTPTIKDSNGNIKYVLTSQPTSVGYDAEILAPVSKGDVISIDYNVGDATKSFRFIYAKGNGSLYFFVASVAQNAPLANLGRIEETKVDKNSSWGFPSNRYIDLELGASGSTYTAPANGYFCWNGIVNNSYFILTIGATDVSYVDNAVKTAKRCYTANSFAQEAKAFVAEVVKNTVIHVWFGGDISGSFKFIFAEGSN